MRTVICTVPRSDVSSAVSVASPSPCIAWPSPNEISAPGTATGMYNVDPATSSLLSRLPACGPGGPLEMRPTSGFGATPIDPKNGASFSVTPGANDAVPARSSNRTR